jgi:DNA-binding GntR family transcriptional regulator
MSERTASLDAIQPRALPDFVADRLRRAILEGRFAPGERLVERQIAEQFQISKTPVREALQELKRRGLVSSRTHRGTEVRVVDAQMVRDIYQVRMALESEAIRYAVPEHDEASCKALRATLERAADAGRGGDLVELIFVNRELHAQLLTPCPNRMLKEMIEELSDQVALIAVSGWRTRPSWDSEQEQHTRIVEAVERGDADGAADLLREHIEQSLGHAAAAADGDGPDRP